MICLSPFCTLLWLCSAIAAGTWFYQFLSEEFEQDRRGYLAASIVMVLAVCLTYSSYCRLHLVWVFLLIHFIVRPLVTLIPLRRAVPVSQVHAQAIFEELSRDREF